MALTGFYGDKKSFVGPEVWHSATLPSASSALMDAANEAIIFIGRINTSDGGSHTLDTSGSSAIAWRTAAVTFANAGTTFKVGVAPVDTGTGAPGRASNASDVISFDVSKSMTGGGGGVTANAWQSHVPDTGSKSIANGDLVAVCFQMTARGGADVINIGYINATQFNRPSVTGFLGGSYAAQNGLLNVFITFADGATGWIDGGEVFSTNNTRTWNSGSATKEYGQLYKLPFPVKIYGLYGFSNTSADLDLVLYSDPLGTPVAEKTIAVDANTVASNAAGRRFRETFASPYTTTADQLVVAGFKPGASNIDAYYKTLGSAGIRVTDPWGVEGYGVSRATGAFANANSSLDHYYIGLICGAYDDGAGGAAGGLIRHPGMNGGLNG
jgi:hypothetical protein